MKLDVVRVGALKQELDLSNAITENQNKTKQDIHIIEVYLILEVLRGQGTACHVTPHAPSPASPKSMPSSDQEEVISTRQNKNNNNKNNKNNKNKKNGEEGNMKKQGINKLNERSAYY